MDIVKCFAFNKAGLRCMQAAGHDGPHAHAIEWDDDDCWVPGTEFDQPSRTAEPLVEHLVAVPKSSGKCVICSHLMHSSLCGQPDSDGFECDCANGIEE